MAISALAFSLLLQLTAAEEAFLTCTSIEESDVRLACFDRAAEPLSKVIEKRARDAEDRFGQVAPDTDDRQLDEIETAVLEVDLGQNGNVTFHLENGHVWRKLRSSGRTIRESQLGRIETAVIKKAALGSHRMTVEPLGWSFKVKRVK